VSSQSITLQMK